MLFSSIVRLSRKLYKLELYYNPSLQSNWLNSLQVAANHGLTWFGIYLEGLQAATIHEFSDDGTNVPITYVLEMQRPLDSGRFERMVRDARHYRSRYHLGVSTAAASVEFFAQRRHLHGNPQRIRDCNARLPILAERIRNLELELTQLQGEMQSIDAQLQNRPGMPRLPEDLEGRIRAAEIRQAALARQKESVASQLRKASRDLDVNRTFLSAVVEITHALNMQHHSSTVRPLIEYWGEFIAARPADFFPVWRNPIQGVDTRLPLLRQVWGDQDNNGTQPRYDVAGPKLGGMTIGALFTEQKTRADGSEYIIRWLGKLGWYAIDDELSVPHELQPFTASLRNNIAEKLASDIYYFLSHGQYFVPETRLAKLPMRNQYTESYAALTDIRRRLGSEDGIFLMSQMVDGYHDLCSLDHCISRTESKRFSDFVSEGNLPEEAMIEGRRLPIKGLMSLIAVARLLCDIDVLGGNLKNAGYYIERAPNGDAQALVVVKIDCGQAMLFSNRQNNLAQGRLADRRDVQFGSGQSQPIHWTRLTTAQRAEFVVAFTEGIRILTAPGFLDFMIMRHNLFNQESGVAVTPTSIKRLTAKWIKWLIEQTGIYASSFLFEMSRLGNLDAVKLLLQNPMVDVNSQHNQINHDGQYEGKTALFISSERGHLAIVKLLVARGARLDIRDNGGWTPLRVAEQMNREEVKAYLRGVQARAATHGAAPAAATGGRTSPASATLLRPSPPRLVIENRQYNQVTNQGAGNCFFFALAQALGLPESEHARLRSEGSDYLAANLHLFVPYPLAVYEDIEDFINRMRHDGTYVEAALIAATAAQHNLRLTIFMRDDYGNINPEPQYITNPDPLPETRNVQLLLSGQHYEYLMPLAAVAEAAAEPVP